MYDNASISTSIDGHSTSAVDDYLSFSFISEVTVTIVSIIQILFFLKKYQEKQCEWELIYVALMEGLSGAAHLMFSHNFESFMYVLLPDETPINWLRYAEWLSTCPIIARHLWALCSMNKNTGINMDHLTVILMLVQTMIATGAWGAMAGLEHGTGLVNLGASYWTLCFISWLLWMFLYWRMWILFQTGLAHEKDPIKHRALFEIMCLYFVTWTFFPVFFMLGPETYSAVGTITQNALHATGDLLAKNYMGHLCWRFHWSLHSSDGHHREGHHNDSNVEMKDMLHKGGGSSTNNILNQQVQKQEKYILVDTNPIAFQIFQSVVEYCYHSNVEVVTSSDSLFASLHNTIPGTEVTILISYALVGDNTDLLIQSIKYTTTGKQCNIVIFGSSGNIHEKVPSQYYNVPQVTVLENLYDQNAVVFVLESLHIQPQAGMVEEADPIDTEILLKMQEIKLKLDNLIDGQLVRTNKGGVVKNDDSYSKFKMLNSNGMDTISTGPDEASVNTHYNQWSGYNTNTTTTTTTANNRAAVTYSNTNDYTPERHDVNPISTALKPLALASSNLTINTNIAPVAAVSVSPRAPVLSHPSLSGNTNRNLPMAMSPISLPPGISSPNSQSNNRNDSVSPQGRINNFNQYKL